MFKFISFIVLVISFVAATAKPQYFAAYSSPYSAAYAVAPSSAVVSREYHGVSSPLIASPYVSAYSSPFVAAAPAYAAYSAYSAPILV